MHNDPQMIMYATNQLKIKWDTCVLSCERMCLCVPHIATRVSNIIIRNLQPLSINFVLPYPFLSHLRKLNNAETPGEYPDNNISRAPRIKWLNNWKNTGLKERNSFIASTQSIS